MFSQTPISALGSKENSGDSSCRGAGPCRALLQQRWARKHVQGFPGLRLGQKHTESLMNDSQVLEGRIFFSRKEGSNFSGKGNNQYPRPSHTPPRHWVIHTLQTQSPLCRWPCHPATKGRFWNPKYQQGKVGQRKSSFCKAADKMK